MPIRLSRIRFTMYDPPYESPLEDAFAWGLTKHLRPGTNLQKQVEVRTICGDFRLDFVATTASGLRVAYECDGAEFHEAQRDEWRDAMILGSNAVDTIIRLRGSDLTYHLNDVLWLLANWNSDVFSDRSQQQLLRLASDSVRSHRHHILLLRRNRSVPSDQREFWQTAFRFASSMDGGSLDLDSVLARWRETIRC